MKEWITKYQKAIVGTGAISVLLICYFQQKELANLRNQIKELNYLNGGDIAKAQYIDSLQNSIDSLSDEVFMKSTIIMRYELSTEYLKEVNPSSYAQFQNYFDTETE